MMSDYAQIAATLATFLAPFTPYLVEGGKKFAGEAGKSGWLQAQKVWGSIMTRFGNDKKLDTAAKALAADPEDDDFQRILAKALAVRLKDDPRFANELLDAMGEGEIIQKVQADRNSWIQDVVQEIEGAYGSQIIDSSDSSTIIAVKQTVKRPDAKST